MGLQGSVSSRAMYCVAHLHLSHNWPEKWGGGISRLPMLHQVSLLGWTGGEAEPWRQCSHSKSRIGFCASLCSDELTCSWRCWRWWRTGGAGHGAGSTECGRVRSREGLLVPVRRSDNQPLRHRSLWLQACRHARRHGGHPFCSTGAFMPPALALFYSTYDTTY